MALVNTVIFLLPSSLAHQHLPNNAASGAMESVVIQKIAPV
jgi:hypothetical protein